MKENVKFKAQRLVLRQVQKMLVIVIFIIIAVG
jgi:hypothetical protein